MKRIVAIIAVIWIVQLSFAQHYIGVGASVSSPFQLDKSTATKPLVSWGEGVTLQYQYRHGHFLMSIGAAVSGEHPRVGVEKEPFFANMVDTRGIPFTYIGLLESRSDMSSSLWFHTPVMIGFEAHSFYMMVGAQYSVFLASWTHQRAQLAAAADYLGRYYTDYIITMPTHGYDYYPQTPPREQMKYKNDVRLLVELGGTLKIGQGKNGLDQLLRIGAFAEVGLMNVLDQPSTPKKTEWYTDQFLYTKMHHIYSAADANVGAVRNIVVGVRVTCLFPTGEEKSKDKDQKKSYKISRKNPRYKCRCLGGPYFYYY